MEQAPGNIYSCIVCGKDIQTLEGCSHTNGEEGYGQACICMKCKYQTSENKIQSYNFNEESIFNMNARTEKKLKRIKSIATTEEKAEIFLCISPEKLRDN